MNESLTTLVTIIATGSAAFALNLVIIPVVLFISHERGWYDTNEDRKIHTEDTPRLGGIGFYVSFVLLTIIGAEVVQAGENDSVVLEFLPIFIGLTIVFLMGLFDDFRSLSPQLKLFLQVLAATVVTSGSFLIDEITVPMSGAVVEFGLIAYPLTILWIVSLVNAVNFIDGMDGLAGGTAAIAAFFTAVLASVLDQPAVAVAAIAVFGATAGFLVFNLPPAKLFMGDSGSCTLGFLLAVFPLMGGGMSATGIGLVPTLTLLFVPLLDTVAAILRRIRKGVPIYQPDSDHLHHKLLRLGFSTGRILAIVYGAGLLSGLAAVSWILLSGFARSGIVIAFWTLVLIGFLVLHWARYAKLPE